jgi:deoxyribodipyrimidine photo-lyase
MATNIIWFRRDLRLNDHPALWQAAQEGFIIPLYILDPEESAGAAERWWRHHSLQQLRDTLSRRGIPLILRRGNPLQILIAVIAATRATGVFWNRRYDPTGIAQDTAIKTHLRSKGITVRSFTGDCLVEPWLHEHDGLPHKVFTPFWKSLLARFSIAAPLPEPELLPLPEYRAEVLKCEALEDWCLLPTQPDWALGFMDYWAPGEAGAQTRFANFLDDGLDSYSKGRNFPARNSVSRLSPHLAHGEISPRQIWQQTRTYLCQDPTLEKQGEHFLRELGWREFSWHLLFHFPSLPEIPLRAEFADFPWQNNAELWQRWCAGQTGYPIVDAGMRELWHTGWMHNRVRMICASFLIKDLLIPWQKGADWFGDTLVDADLANNSVSWQWVAGCGADAAPYFRIFNPVLQGEKFDPEGTYVRRWVPELAALPDRYIHQPWNADAAQLKYFGLTLDLQYPRPIIDHLQARRRAMDAFQSLGKAEQSGIS